MHNALFIDPSPSMHIYGYAESEMHMTPTRSILCKAYVDCRASWDGLQSHSHIPSNSHALQESESQSQCIYIRRWCPVTTRETQSRIAADRVYNLEVLHMYSTSVDRCAWSTEVGQVLQFPRSIGSWFVLVGYSFINHLHYVLTPIICIHIL